jgi:hypothetical protein
MILGADERPELGDLPGLRGYRHIPAMAAGSHSTQPAAAEKPHGPARQHRTVAPDEMRGFLLPVCGVDGAADYERVAAGQVGRRPRPGGPAPAVRRRAAARRCTRLCPAWHHACSRRPPVSAWPSPSLSPWPGCSRQPGSPAARWLHGPVRLDNSWFQPPVRRTARGLGHESPGAKVSACPPRPWVSPAGAILPWSVEPWSVR